MSYPHQAHLVPNAEVVLDLDGKYKLATSAFTIILCKGFVYQLIGNVPTAPEFKSTIKTEWDLIFLA